MPTTCNGEFPGHFREMVTKREKGMSFPAPSTPAVPKKDRLDNRLRNDFWRLASDGSVPHPHHGGFPHRWTTSEIAEVSNRSPRVVRLGIAESRERAGILANAS